MSTGQPAGEIERARSLRRSLADLGIVDASLDEAYATIERPGFLIAFAGEWNSGKSSLINLVLAEHALPVGRFPETGATCLLHYGEEARATAHWADRVEELDHPTPENLRKWIQLTRDGLRTDMARLPHRIEIALPNRGLPAGVTFVDTPGLNDDPAMAALALASTRQADVVVWVLNSRNFLTTVETDALRTLVEERGLSGLVFVLNLFMLQDGPDEWDQLRREDLPTDQDKLSRFLEECDADHDVALIPVSARAAAANGGGYGSDRLAQALQGLLGEQRAELLAARRAAAARRALLQAESLISPTVRKYERAYEQARRTWSAYERDAELRRTFVGVARKAAERILNEAASTIGSAAEEIAGEITTADIKRDDSYSKTFNKAAKREARRAAERLYEELGTIAQSYGQPAPDSEAGDAIRALLKPSKVDITVADNGGVGGGMAAGAATGAIIGSVIPIVGTLLGGFIGGMLGGAAGASDALDRDVNETRQSLRDAASEVANELQSMRSNLKDLIKSLRSPLSEPPRPDESQLSLWRELLAQATTARDG